MTSSDNIVGLDVGTSSVRALLFDRQFRQYKEFGFQRKYQFTTTSDGGVEIDPDLLVSFACECLENLHAQMAAASLNVSAVGICTFWHCFVGIDKDEKPTTPIVHLLDTRAHQQALRLTETFEPSWIHAITGCMPHTSYWPAKLLWFRDTHPERFNKTLRWLSVGEYLLLKLTGQARDSLCMISASGMWDQRRDDYCEEMLEATGVKRHQLTPAEELDQPAHALLPSFASRWPFFQSIPWYPAYGDGACNSIGSGCVTPKRFALMVGTTGALRVIVKRRNITLPRGIWGYRVDRERSILGGATSNGGEVFRWASQTLSLTEKTESSIAGREPGSHGLTILPYLAGERSPYWRPELRATISGMSLSTTPADILQACLESVSLRFRQIYTLLTKPFAPPDQIIASGGGLLQSPIWPQMMADALGRSLLSCLEPEASCRGAAMLAAEQMGLISDIEDVATQLGESLHPDPRRTEIYRRLLERDNRLFNALYGPSSVFEHSHPLR